MSQKLPARIIAAFERNRYHGYFTNVAELRKAIDSKPEFLQHDQWHDQTPTPSTVV
jgi:hypothetical protein